MIKKLFTLFVGMTLGIGELNASWTKPAAYSCYQDNTLGQLVMDEDGNALCIWQCYGGINVGSLLAKGSWTAITLAIPAEGETFGKANLAIDLEGNAIAVWEVIGANNSGSFLMYSQKPSGGSWSTPIIPDKFPFNWVSLGGITFDYTGIATLCWFSSNGTQSALYSSDLPKGSSTWDAPQMINSFASVSCCEIQVIIAMSQNQDGSIVLKLHYTNGWASPYTLSQGTAIISPVLACFYGSYSTFAAVVWMNSEDNSIWGNGVDFGSESLGVPTQLSLNGKVNSNPTVTFNSDGDAVAVWGNNKGELYWSRMEGEENSWSTPQLITTKLLPGSTPFITPDNNGNVFVLWQSAHPAAYQVQMLAGNSSKWVSLGTALSTAHFTPDSAALAVSSNDAAVAIITLEGELFPIENPNLLQNQ